MLSDSFQGDCCAQRDMGTGTTKVSGGKGGSEPGALWRLQGDGACCSGL